MKLKVINRDIGLSLKRNSVRKTNKKNTADSYSCASCENPSLFSKKGTVLSGNATWIHVNCCQKLNHKYCAGGNVISTHPLASL